jgi:uncharacterized protein (DUF427 family)
MSLSRENVQDYPRPPAVEPVAERLSVVLGGVEVAATMRGYRVLETHHAPTYYFPPEDIAPGALRAAGAGSSFCEWKGAARYFDVAGGGRTASRAAWAYPAPTPAFTAIAGYVAFYPAPMDGCFVGHVQARPQPGGFYGGWVTPNLDGIVKGGPGTEGW